MVTDVLDRVAAERGGVIGLEPGLTVSPDDTWTSVAELLRAPYTLLGELADETAARWKAPRHVGAALFWKTYAYWHTMPMALGWALDAPIPLMPLEATYFKVSDAGVTIAASRLEWGTGAPAIARALADAQEPLVRTLASLAKVGERTLWGSTAEALVHPLTSVVPADFMELLRQVGKPVDGLIEPHGDGYFRRTCCLWVTLPGADACGSCCVLRPRRRP
ncbi:hypothetical protein ACWGH8_30765 [Nonomuraea muscovyensis]|uniref:Ferric iron reductase protein FhuF n=1 Tax=Nonomuraea muscovyensis TaxID=1124761 RepID=A0A7X0CAA5_9ACTN|nr:(2Fe-2S)-binding protein [Nonomuraea muscovyensis]MBB6351463.1 ferric iron reductase protein FhuF [Nonomuraea muscovyensis]